MKNLSKCRCWMVCIAFLAAIPTLSFGQDHDGYEIILTVTPSNIFSRTEIYKVLRSRDSIHGTRIIQDTLHYHDLWNDKAYPKLIKGKKLTSEETQRRKIIVDSLTKSYRPVYETSIKFSVSSDRAYGRSLDKLVTTDSVSVTPKDDRIIMDGTGYQIIIKRNGKQLKYYAHSTTSYTHPLFYEFLISTLALFPKLNQ